MDGNSSAIGAGWNMTNSILGSGIIGLPFAIAEAGFIPGLLIMLIVAVLTAFTVQLLVRVAKAYSISNYEELCRTALGEFGFWCVSIFQFFFAFGAMVSYMVIVRQNVGPTLQALTGSDSWLLNQYVDFLVAAVVVVLPLSSLKHMSALSYASSVSLAAVAFMVLAVGLELPSAQLDLGLSTKQKYFSFGSHVIRAFGAVGFAFVCQHQSFQIHCSMKDDKHFGTVANTSLASAFVASATMGILGYCTFWSDTDADIFKSYDDSGEHQSTTILIARLMLGLNLFCTFPTELLVCRHTIKMIVDEYYEQRLFVEFGQPVFDAERRAKWREAVLRTVRAPEAPYSQIMHYSLTIVLWVAAVGIAALVDDLGLVLELTGSFSAAGLAFILPAACHLLLGDGPADERDPNDKSFAVSWFVLVFGVAVFIASFSTTLIGAFSGE